MYFIPCPSNKCFDYKPSTFICKANPSQHKSFFMHVEPFRFHLTLQDAVFRIFWANLFVGWLFQIPQASTCFNLLKLSNYDTEKQLREKLLIATRHGAEGFSFGWCSTQFAETRDDPFQASALCPPDENPVISECR